jgi:hypothetical protein
VTWEPDPFDLIRRANPVPDPERAGTDLGIPAATLMEEIITMGNHGSVGRRTRKRITLIAAALLVVTATAAGAAAFRDGLLDVPPFSGEHWQLIVGEEANGDTGTYKVCHRFAPAEEPDDGNGFGPSGCVTWPSDAAPGRIIIDAVPVETLDGTLLFLDLSATPVGSVSTVTDAGQRVEVEPFAMPQSRKQFAVVELPAGTRSVTVRLVGGDGAVLEHRSVRIPGDG